MEDFKKARELMLPMLKECEDWLDTRLDESDVYDYPESRPEYLSRYWNGLREARAVWAKD